MNTTNISGTPIAWEETGTGEPILLIMGRAYPRQMWHRVILALAAHRRVLWFDNRGIGESTPLRGPVTVEAMAADAIAVLDAAGVGRADVYGVSLGGLVAQEVALAYPDRVRALILGCTGSPSDETFRGRRAPVADLLMRVLPWGVHVRLLGALAKPPADTKDKVREDIEILLAHPSATKVVLAQGEAALAYRSRDRIGSIEAPTLVLHGEADKTVPVHLGRDLADGIPAATFITYPGAGHNYLTDATDASTADVLDFLQKAQATDGS